MDKYDQSGNGILDLTNKGDNYNLLALLSACGLWCGSYVAKQNNESTFKFMDCLSNNRFEVGVANIKQSKEDFGIYSSVEAMLVKEQPKALNMTEKGAVKFIKALALFRNTMLGIVKDFDKTQEYQAINKTAQDLINL